MTATCRHALRYTVASSALFLFACTNYGLLEKLENPGGIARKVFVSAVITAGNFSGYTAGLFTNCAGSTGIARADCGCRVLAAQAALPNSSNFAAWLSNQNNDARCRVQGLAGTSCGADETGSRWVDIRGNTVALSYSQLISGGLSTPIQYTESGNQFMSTSVITGTSSTGTRTPDDCSNYSGAASVNLGATGDTGPGWTDAQVNSCPTGATGTIYCFETPTVPAAPLP